MNKCKYK